MYKFVDEKYIVKLLKKLKIIAKYVIIIKLQKNMKVFWGKENTKMKHYEQSLTFVAEIEKLQEVKEVFIELISEIAPLPNFSVNSNGDHLLINIKGDSRNQVQIEKLVEKLNTENSL